MSEIGRNYNGQMGNVPVAPLFTDEENAGNNLKSANDRYQVYVNGDYVGDKVLSERGDSVQHVESFLTMNDVHGIQIETSGDHVNVIIVDKDQDVERVKQVVDVYLRNR